VFVVVAAGVASSALAHPLGNFSISQYTAIRVARDVIELRYLIDMAEIPTFQEIQDTAIVPEAGHVRLGPYVARKAETLKDGLRLEVDDQRLELRTESRDVIFPPGAGGLPTMKLGVVYRATLPPGRGPRARLYYHDGNYADRAGWKEVIATAGAGARIESASVPERDRSGQLSDYPTDLLDSPPQVREARVVFERQTPPPALARAPSPPPNPPVSPRAEAPPAAAVEPPSRPPTPTADGSELRLRANRQATPRNALADLVTVNDLGLGVVLFALAAAAALGAFHALEPGHGKTVVAAYLVGSRGTASHAVLLGLTVTASHTAGVYLLGGIALYASRYVVPERLYPWLGVFSGLVIAGLGLSLVLRRYAALGHRHEDGHAHTHEAGDEHYHHHHAAAHHHGHGHGHDHHHPGDGPVSLPALVALGVTGGIVPCPAAVVVLLSALSLNRVGFGLLLIVAFSVGLAAVLITIGVLMVYARRAMARFSTDGPLVRRWLPLASSAVITIVGVVIAFQSLVAAGILHVKL
jgi:ABC-type nickel/cobalt efflux system permease component RcnA